MVELTDIVGQEQSVSQVAAAMGSARPPHAWIFAGPAGVGRRTTAFALAKALLCLDPQPSQKGQVPLACKLCASCRAFDAGTHPDFHAVNKQLARFSEDSEIRKRVMQNLSIEVVREFVLAPANRASTLERGRVFVIDEAELMTAEAQNSLLKVLEEPPPRVTFILLCRSEQELLPTTRSRCALVRFGPLPFDFVERQLVAAGIEAAEAAFSAQLTAGSVGESVRLAQSGLYPVKRELLERLSGLAQSADAELGDWLTAQAESLAKAATSADPQLSGTLATRQGAAAVLALLSGIFSDVLSLASGREVTLVNSDQQPEIRSFAERFNLDQAADCLAQLGRYEQLLWRNVNAKVLWDNVLITCATAAPLEV